MNFLPPEMVFSILHHLERDSKSISSCAQVCRDWSGFCQQILFHHVRVYNADRCDSLLHLLEDSTHVIPFIHVLSISSFSYDRVVDGAVDPHLQLDWQDIHTEIISRVLRLLKHLQCLAVSFGWERDVESQGRLLKVKRVLNNNYRSVIAAALALPSMTSFDLRNCILTSGVIDIRYMLQNAATLTSLTISCKIATFSDLPDLWSLDQIERHVRLEELKVYEDPLPGREEALLKWILHPRCILDLQGLRKLNFRGCQDPVRLSTLFNMHGAFLQFLRLEPSFGTATVTELDFCYCHSLQELEIDLTYYTPIPQYSPPEWLCRSLLTIPLSAPLQSVFVAIPVILDDEVMQIQNSPPPDWDAIRTDWRRLNETLAAPRLQSIPSLTISIAYECDHPTPHREVVMEELTADHVGIVDYSYY